MFLLPGIWSQPGKEPAEAGPPEPTWRWAADKGRASTRTFPERETPVEKAPTFQPLTNSNVHSVQERGWEKQGQGCTAISPSPGARAPPRPLQPPAWLLEDGVAREGGDITNSEGVKSPKHPLSANPNLDHPDQPFSSNRKCWRSGEEKPIWH